MGAVDFIKKPDKKEDMANHKAALVEKIFTVAMAKMDNFKRVKLPGIIKNKKHQVGNRCESLIIINSGMGGYAELIRMAPLLRPDNKTCLVLFQDMPDAFIKPVSDYLDQRSSLKFTPLQDGSATANGFCYISPNGYIVRYNHKNTISNGGTGLINIEPQSMFDGDRGSMFHLFLNSVADSFTGQVLVLLLSGADVGDPVGLRNIRKKGGKILIQKINTCLMPHPLKIIKKEELADHEVSPDEISEYIGSAALEG